MIVSLFCNYYYLFVFMSIRNSNKSKKRTKIIIKLQLFSVCWEPREHFHFKNLRWLRLKPYSYNIFISKQQPQQKPFLHLWLLQFAVFIKIRNLTKLDILFPVSVTAFKFAGMRWKSSHSSDVLWHETSYSDPIK